MRIDKCLLMLCVVCLELFSPLVAKDWSAVGTFNSDALNIVNTSKDKVVANIGKIATPTFIATNSNGSHIYFTNQSANTVGVIERATQTIIETIPVGATPVDITVFGIKAYVTNFDSASITIINTLTNTVIDTILGLPNQPRSIAITPDGAKAYVVSNPTSGTPGVVSVINLATNALTPVIGTFPKQLHEVIFNPTGTKAYVTSLSGQISVIDATTNTITENFDGGTGSRGIAISNDGTTAYIADSFIDQIAVVNLASNTIVASIFVGSGANPNNVVLSPNNKILYAINTGSNTISMINTANNEIIGTILNLGVAPRSMAITPDGLLGYVVNIISSSIDTINLETNRVIDHFQNPFNGVGIPAINPMGTLAYVPNQRAKSILGLTVIDIKKRKVLGFIPEPNDAALEPTVVAITPDGTKAYVTNKGTDSPNSGQVTVFDLIKNKALTTIPVGIAPYGIAITPDGTHAYVTNLGRVNVEDGTTLTKINLNTNTVVGTVSGLINPNTIAITPNGKKAYVSSSQNPTIYVVDLITDTVSATISTRNTQGIAIMPDGTRAYMANPDDNSVSVIDIATDQLIDIISVGTKPLNLSITPDGKKVYVMINGNPLEVGNQTIIDTSTHTIIETIETPFYSLGIAITPDQAPVATFKAKKTDRKRKWIFNARASHSPTGKIQNYRWDFGDGEIINTSRPIISHTYAKAKSYVVRLKVTNSAGTSTSKVFTGQTLSRNGGPSARTSIRINND